MAHSRANELDDLIEASLPLVFSTYDEAVSGRMHEPVVLLIDCEDELGREIAEAWVGREAVEDAVLSVQTERDDGPEVLTTVFARAMPLAACREEIPAVFPYLARSFEQPPADSILVVVVAAGGAATYFAPFSARADVG
jgi:hypothetical protein